MEESTESRRMASWIYFGPVVPSRPSPSRLQSRSHGGAAQRTISKNYSPRTIKRRQENLEEVKWVEPCLVRLCREKRWPEVIQRCRSHPEETVPQPATQASNRYDPHALKRIVKTEALVAPTEERIFQETPLGIACASPEIQFEQVLAAIHALITTNPSQIHASQLIPGHTPLRDALKNPRMTPSVLTLLAGAASGTKQGYSSFQNALSKTDRNGFQPLDHLIISIQLGSHPQALELLKEFIRCSNVPSRDSAGSTSPLIRLLSLGTSFGSCGSDYERPSTMPSVMGRSRLEHIFEAMKYLLETDPSLIHWHSKITGCSPLHVALRNYGDCTELIQELVHRDPACTMMTLRNHYGDLPLHVACSVGVPMAVLQLILERTLSAGGRTVAETGEPNPLIWSVNHSGYTPIDLEWVRHIESGKSFYSARSFYPLEPTGVRKHCFKQDEYYQDLLREAVDQVVQQPPTCLKEPLLCREKEAKNTFGVLIDRIKLLVSSAATNLIPTDPKTSLLHNACKLCSPGGPNLPLPLLELILWMHPEQIEQGDANENLPIHYAVTMSDFECKSSNLQNWSVWEKFVIILLAEAPETAKVRDGSFRLPLHRLLAGSNDVSSSAKEINGSRWRIVEKLIQLHPESVDIQDAATLLYPFMLTATDPNATVDMTFRLLRHSPSRCNRSHKSTVAHS